MQKHAIAHDARVFLLRRILFLLLSLCLPFLFLLKLLGTSVLNVHRRDLRLALAHQIAGRRKTIQGHALQQKAARQQRFSHIGKRFAQPFHRFLVVRFHGFRQRQRLVQQLGKLLVEVGAAALHPFKKCFFVQLLCAHRANGHAPLQRHVGNVFLQLVERLLVEVGDVCKRVVEKLDEQTPQVFFLVDER